MQTSTPLYSYQKLTEIALKFYIIQHHNNSRIGVISGIGDSIGETLCHLQSILGDNEMSESVYKLTQEVADMDISQMVPYTCRTLVDNVAALLSIEDYTRKSLLRGLNEFAWMSVSIVPWCIFVYFIDNVCIKIYFWWSLVVVFNIKIRFKFNKWHFNTDRYHYTSNVLQIWKKISVSNKKFVSKLYLSTIEEDPFLPKLKPFSFDDSLPWFIWI